MLPGSFYINGQPVATTCTGGLSWQDVAYSNAWVGLSKSSHNPIFYGSLAEVVRWAQNNIYVHARANLLD